MKRRFGRYTVTLKDVLARLADGENPKTPEDKILYFLHRISKPTYLGSIAVEIGQSLRRTEEFLQNLEDSGHVRQLSDVEKRQRTLDVRGSVWIIANNKI